MSKSTKNSAHIRLSDTQLVALSSAAQREDGVISISDRLKGAAAQKFAATLIEKGLAREVRAKPGIPVARRDEDGRAYALVVTKLGRAAIHADEDESGKALAKKASKSEKAEEAESEEQAPAFRSAKAKDTSATSSPEEGGSISPATDGRPREGTKLASVIALLARPEGQFGKCRISKYRLTRSQSRKRIVRLRRRVIALIRPGGQRTGTRYGSKKTTIHI